MAINKDYKAKVLSTISGAIDSPESLERTRKNVREAGLRALQASRAGDRREAAKRGKGISEFDRLVGQRQGERTFLGISDIVAQNEAAEKEKKVQRAMRLGETARAYDQLELQKEQLNMQKDNILWDRSFATRQFDEKIAQFDQSLEQANKQFQQRRLDKFKYQKLQNTFQKELADMAKKFQREMQIADRLYRTAENEKQRRHALAVARYQASLMRRPAWQRVLGGLTGGIGAVGSLLTGLGPKGAGVIGMDEQKGDTDDIGYQFTG